MKRILCLLLLTVAPVFGQPAITLPEDMITPPAAPVAPAPGEGDLEIEVVALKGSATGRSSVFTDEELKPYRKILETLTPNDTFEIIAIDKKPVPLNTEQRFTVNGLYTAYVTPLGARETPEGGQRHELQMRVEMLSGNDYVDALRARGEAAERQALVLRGMNLDIGELIVLVRVIPEGQDSDGNSESSEQDESGEEQEQQEQQQKDEQQAQNQQDKPMDEESEGQDGEQEAPELREPEEGEKEAEEGQEEMASDSEAGEQEGEAGETGPQDMETIEAILESLEEKDRQEQRNARYRRSKVTVNGDWW